MPAKRQACGGSWGILPEHLLHLIMAKVEDLAGIEDVADMRLVTKAWRAAFQDYSSSHGHFIVSSQLEDLLALQPKLTSLKITAEKPHTIKLNPLTTAQHLTSLDLIGSTYQNERKKVMEPRVKLDKLPPGLRKLALDAVYIDPDHFQNLKCTEITGLVFCGQQNEASEVLLLLEQLPKLQDLSVGYSTHVNSTRTAPQEETLRGILKRSEPTLTKLQLGYGQLKSTMEPWQSTSALLELLLQFCQISGTSFTSAQPALQTLVKLDINFCDLYAGALFLQPLHNLRYLRLRETSVDFLRLAPSTLHTLVYEHKGGSDDELGLQRIAQLTGLKRLELICVSFSDREIGPDLGALDLEELILIECPEAETFLFTDESRYRSLTSLHIEEKVQDAMMPIQLARITREYMTRYIESMERATNFASILHISGNSKYLRHCMKTFPHRWHKSFATGQEVSESSRLYDERSFRVWTKPESMRD